MDKVQKMSYHSNIWKMYIFQVLLSLHFMGGVIVPFFTDWGQITFTQIMMLQSFFTFSIFMLEVPTGTIADYFGRKTSLILAALVNSFAVLLYSSYPNFGIFILAEFCWAMSVALVSGADEALIYDSLKRIKQEDNSKKVFARYRSSHLTGIMVAAPIGSYIAALSGVRFSMMATSLPMFIAFIFAFTLKEPLTKRKIESKRYLDTMISGIKYFRDHSILKILAFDSISISIISFFIIWTYQPLLGELNLAILYFGFVTFGITLAEIIIMNNFQRLEKFFGSRSRYLAFSSLITSLCFMLLAFVSSIPLAIILIMATAGFGMTRKTLFMSYMNQHIRSENRATVISTISMTEQFIRAISYPIIGLIIEYSLSAAFVTLSILALTCTIISKVEEKHLSV